MNFFLRFRRLSLGEWLVVGAIIAILVAIFLPAIQWFADGEQVFPVRVFVFDADADQPIAGAQVIIFHHVPLVSEDVLSKPQKPFGARDHRRIDEATTTADGGAVLNYRFKSSASHNRPTPHMHLRWAWVEVHADGYGGVIVPVRHESRPTTEVRRESELLVPIGLLPDRKVRRDAP